MKIIRENLGENEIVVIPQDSDDLYYLYHVISKGDAIKGKTTRKMKDTGDRITLFMKIEVEEIEFHGFGETIRIRGRILETSDEKVSLGSYHAITVELFNQISIIKTFWHQSQINRIRNAQMGKSTPIVVVAMDDEAALVSQVGSHASKILLDLDPGIPRKGHDTDGHQRATLEFFKELALFLRTQREEGVAQYIVIGGPGFTKDAFYDYIKRNYRDLVSNLVIVDASTAGQTGIKEIILSKIPDSFTAAQSAQQQSLLVQEVLEILGRHSGHIAYASNIDAAVEFGAVEKLLILDELMHESKEKRDDIEYLITRVEQIGGKVFLMSSLLDKSNSDILKGLGGIVAILRFPLPK